VTLHDIPPHMAEATAPVWGPFVCQAAEYEGRDPSELAQEVLDGEVTVLLAVDWETKKAKAALGTFVSRLGFSGLRVGILHWIVGRDWKAWIGLLPEVERYFLEHHGCVAVSGNPRKGWSKAFERAGYTIAPHPTNPKLRLVEKDLMSGYG
jgi:hypothetical protein